VTKQNVENQRDIRQHILEHILDFCIQMMCTFREKFPLYWASSDRRCFPDNYYYMAYVSACLHTWSLQLRWTTLCKCMQCKHSINQYPYLLLLLLTEHVLFTKAGMHSIVEHTVSGALTQHDCSHN